MDRGHPLFQMLLTAQPRWVLIVYIPKLHLTVDGKKRPQVTGAHNLGPPPKRRKQDQMTQPHTTAVSPTKHSNIPTIPPKRTVIELDSDGEEIGSKKVSGRYCGKNVLAFLVKQRAKKEIADADDSDSEYSRIHSGFDLRDHSIVGGLSPRSFDN
jgi:hypothetical protein